MASLAGRIEEVVSFERPDLLHVHSPVLNALPALLKGRKLGIPLVYEIRAFWEDAAVNHGTYPHNSLKYRLARSIETWACNKVDQVAVLCNGLKYDLQKRKIPQDKITVIFNGIDISHFNKAGPDQEYLQSWKLAGKKVVGFIGSFYHYEGLDLLVEAFSRLTSTRSDVVLLLVGGGKSRLQLVDQLRRLNLTDKVLMPGRIPHERIPGVYALIDVLAYPRYSMRLTELVTPLKPLEAMAMGAAVAASDVGGHRELVRHGKTGLLFSPNDVSDLLKAIERLLDDDVLRLELKENAVRWVRQRHTWEKTASAYSDMYLNALQQRQN
jgi:PEP-CTERM/exosortase A-associated glycosyltransferase